MAKRAKASGRTVARRSRPKAGQKKKEAGRQTNAKRAVKKAILQDRQIIHDEPIFGKKHPLCAEVAHFYSLPGQLNLVLHGVPFHLIEDGFVRFHAVQSTIIGWKFTVLYTVILFSTIANAVLFSSRYLDIMFWIFIVVAAAHALINIYMAKKTADGKEVCIPVITGFAKSISG
ncbi:MAG: hypothetical protein V1822_02075 [Candidatus Micrarchaeota archaeon]